MCLVYTLPILAAASFWRTDGFQIQHQQRAISTSSTRLFNQVLSLESTAAREVDQFQNWAAQCGVQIDSGFCLAADIVDGNEDYFAATSSGGSQGSRALFVPGEVILSASQIAQEYQEYLGACFQILEEKNQIDLYQQFYLFVKILTEFEQGMDSPYYPWLASLPKKWNTAVSFDYFCMSTLPPYIKQVATEKRDEFDAFNAALQVYDYLTPQTKDNIDILKFAHNVVFTRSFPSEEGDLKIVPLADYLNHGCPDNVALCYNENGDCEVILKEDIAPGSALTLSYGDATNPSVLLATYGFLNEVDGTYCKILFTQPSQKLKDVGYDAEKMLFYSDGSIAQEVWDVMLYSKLERAPGMADAKNAFYEAHMAGDEETKFAIHSQFQDSTCSDLLSHVENILKEVEQLTRMMNKFNDEDRHPRLPLLFKHHALVTYTFKNVREYLLGMSG